MKNKKIIFLGIIILIIILGIFLFFKENNHKIKDKENSNLTNQELKDMEYVDEKLKELTNSSEYKDLSLENKVTEAKKVLKKLKQDKYINYYNYDSNNYMFSFEYKCGVLGGLMIKDFDPMLN